MADIYQRSVSTFGGAFAADKARLNFAGVGNAGLLLQSIQLQYQLAVTRLYELSSRNVYYVGGRTQGQASMTRVIGPRTLLSAFYEQYGDVCRARGNTLTLSVDGDCDSAGRNAAYTARYCVLSSVGIQITAGEMVISESSSLMFSSLEYSGG